MTFTKLEKVFKDRESLISYLKEITSYDDVYSNIIGGRDFAEICLSNIDVANYNVYRNYGKGKVTYLSPYIHHGIMSINEVRDYVLAKHEDIPTCRKFIQQLAWRDFWQRYLNANPDFAWKDVENYKTGFNPDDYLNYLPDDISSGTTPVACINSFIKDLIKDGYVHNHGRLYIASYVIHFRRVKWQVGAKWFLKHLLDGDIASNNLSWQWVASTFSNKPYIFNLENVHKYFEEIVDTSASNNEAINFSYDDLNRRLFPNL